MLIPAVMARLAPAAIVLITSAGSAASPTCPTPILLSKPWKRKHPAEVRNECMVFPKPCRCCDTARRSGILAWHSLLRVLLREGKRRRYRLYRTRRTTHDRLRRVRCLPFSTYTRRLPMPRHTARGAALDARSRQQ